MTIMMLISTRIPRLLLTHCWCGSTGLDRKQNNSAPTPVPRAITLYMWILGDDFNSVIPELASMR